MRKVLLEDNFLPEAYLDHVKAEIKRLRGGYSREGYHNKRTIRDSSDPRYCGTQYITNRRSILYSIWDRLFWDKMSEKFLETEDFAYIHSLYTKTGSVLLSAYADGDYYGSHIDVDMGSIITAVLMLNLDEQRFSGGDLIIGPDTYPFKNNRLIVFPSCVEHEVTKIKLDSNKYEKLRFSLQYFISAVPFKKSLIDESNHLK